MGTETRKLFTWRSFASFKRAAPASANRLQSSDSNRKRIFCSLHSHRQLQTTPPLRPSNQPPPSTIPEFCQAHVMILNQSFLQLHLSHLIVPLGWIRYAKCPTFALPCSACKVMPVILAAQVLGGREPMHPHNPNTAACCPPLWMNYSISV